MNLLFTHQWVLLTLIATLLWSGTNILDKYILSRLIKNPLLPLIFVSWVGLAAALLIFLFTENIFLPPTSLIVVFFAGISYTIAIFLYFKAVTIEDISKIVALWYITPLFTAILGAVFLNEILTLPKYFGILLLVAGAFMIELKDFRFTFGRGFKLMMLSSLFLAFNYVGVKYALGKSDFWTVFAWARVGAFVAVLPFIHTQWKKMLKTIRKLPKKTIVLLSLNETVGIIGTGFITAAASLGPATLVTAFSSVQPLFVFIFIIALSLFSPKILKEIITKKTLVIKSVAIASIVVGAMLVV